MNKKLLDPLLLSHLHTLTQLLQAYSLKILQNNVFLLHRQVKISLMLLQLILKIR